MAEGGQQAAAAAAAVQQKAVQWQATAQQGKVQGAAGVWQQAAGHRLGGSMGRGEVDAGSSKGSDSTIISKSSNVRSSSIRHSSRGKGRAEAQGMVQGVGQGAWGV